MRKKPVWMVIALMVVLLMAACTPPAATQDAMMEPTDAMMGKTATPEMMEGGPTDAMMEETATSVMPDAGTDAMMDKTGTPAMMEDKTPEAMMDATPIPMTGDGTPEAGMMAPDWFATELTDQQTGETFSVADFKGKVVLVETFAQWCPTCLRQQDEMVKLHEMLGMNKDLVTVSLDVDPNEDAAMLEKYLAKHGFDWHFAIAPEETIHEIGALYGAQFLNPPSAPMLIIDRHGEAHPLPFGVKSAEDLQKALEPFLSDGM